MAAALSSSKDRTYSDFKASIQPYLVNIKHIAIQQLALFKIIDDGFIQQITDETVADYQSFMHLYRYQLKNNTINTIKPSLPVQILWNVHALNPRQYLNDHRSAFGDIVSVRITNNDEFVPHEELKQTLKENEDFLKSVKKIHFIQKLDLQQAVLRQLKFVRKMNVIQNSEQITSAKLEQAMERYIKFLYLMKLDGHTGDRRMGVPALDVDLMWHSHLLDATQYHPMSVYMFPKETDCIIDHDDSICFKKIMELYRVETKSRWMKVYGNDDYFEGRAFGRNLIFTKTGHLFRRTKDADFQATVRKIKGIKRRHNKKPDVDQENSHHDEGDDDAAPPQKRQKTGDVNSDDEDKELKEIESKYFELLSKHLQKSKATK